MQALASDLGVPKTYCAAANLVDYVHLAARFCLDEVSSCSAHCLVSFGSKYRGFSRLSRCSLFVVRLLGSIGRDVRRDRRGVAQHDATVLCSGPSNVFLISAVSVLPALVRVVHASIRLLVGVCCSTLSQLLVLHFALIARRPMEILV